MVINAAIAGGQPQNEMRLEKFIYGGETLGRLPDGRAVFVPYALPGELVSISLVEQKRTYARANLLQVVEPSPDRVVARCPHFTTCGGCHYQHFPHQNQLGVKSQILTDQLERIGRLDSPAVDACQSAGPAWNYRNQMQFHVDQSGALGFQQRKTNEIIPIGECHLPDEFLQSVWPWIEIEPGAGVRRLQVRTGSSGEIMIILEGGTPQAVRYTGDGAVSILAQEAKGMQVISGSPYVSFAVGGRNFRVSAGSFFQANLPVAEAMISHIQNHIPLRQEDTVLELYSGVGLFSAFLAPLVRRYIAVESSPSACDDFVVNLDAFDNVELYQGLAEKVLPSIQASVDILLVDPPRIGLHPDVIEAVVHRLKPRFLAYVSCDPATLARDSLKLVEGGYRLIKVYPFDMFPQTFHIESISYWELIEAV